MAHPSRAGASGSIGGRRRHYSEGTRPSAISTPRFRTLGRDPSRRDYVRGFGYQGGASRQGWGRGAGERGFGVELKRQLHDPGPRSMGMTGFGGGAPPEGNYLEAGDKIADFRIPPLRAPCTWGDNEV